jgi:predicted nucleic acid-binding protein
MNAVRFLDTNILVYAYDLDAPAKRTVAARFVEEGWASPGGTAISVQVLQELHVNLRKRGVPQADASRIIIDFAPWPVVENTIDLLHAALVQQVRWRISLWDALVVAAARASGAAELITEDLNHGQDYDGVRAVNPFRKSASTRSPTR